MQQLNLFEGEHIPMTRCLAALARGDVAAARVALSRVAPGSDEAVEAVRLGLLEAGLEGAAPTAPTPASVHAAFVRALAAGGEGSHRSSANRIGAEAWFRLYAERLLDALSETREASFRGWHALHFALAAGLKERAQQQADELAGTADAGGWTLLEVGRAAAALGAPEGARRLLFAACLCEPGDLDPSPPRLERDAAEALNPPSDALPHLPDELEALFDEAEELELPAPTSAWVPALGILEGLFPSDPGRWPDAYERAGFDPRGPSPPGGETAPHAFLRALLAARRERRETPGGGNSICSEAELRARAAMRDAAPALFARYLERVRRTSFFD